MVTEAGAGDTEMLRYTSFDETIRSDQEEGV